MTCNEGNEVEPNCNYYIPEWGRKYKKRDLGDDHEEAQGDSAIRTGIHLTWWLTDDRLSFWVKGSQDRNPSIVNWLLLLPIRLSFWSSSKCFGVFSFLLSPYGDLCGKTIGKSVFSLCTMKKGSWIVTAEFVMIGRGRVTVRTEILIFKGLRRGWMHSFLSAKILHVCHVSRPSTKPVKQIFGPLSR